MEDVENNVIDNQDLENEYFGSPDKYDYSKITEERNIELQEDITERFNEKAKKLNLSQKSADELMELAIDITKQNEVDIVNALKQMKIDEINQYKTDLMNDEEIGGIKLNQTLDVAKYAYDYFLDDDTKQLFEKEGFNVHPRVVKMFYNIGKMMKNDDIFISNNASKYEKSREDILYSKMN